MFTAEQRQFLRDISATRKANAIKLSRWIVTTDSEQAGVLEEFWDEWIELLGKDGATKFLVYCMRQWTEALRAAKEEQDTKRA
jgi:hypothetical protein